MIERETFLEARRQGPARGSHTEVHVACLDNSRRTEGYVGIGRRHGVVLVVRLGAVRGAPAPDPVSDPADAKPSSRGC